MNELVYSEEIVQGWRGRGLASVSEAGGRQTRLRRPKEREGQTPTAAAAGGGV